MKSSPPRSVQRSKLPGQPGGPDDVAPISTFSPLSGSVATSGPPLSPSHVLLDAPVITHIGDPENTVATAPVAACRRVVVFSPPVSPKPAKLAETDAPRADSSAAEATR